jgi:hypothetical protein
MDIQNNNLDTEKENISIKLYIYNTILKYKYYILILLLILIYFIYRYYKIIILKFTNFFRKENKNQYENKLDYIILDDEGNPVRVSEDFFIKLNDNNKLKSSNLKILSKLKNINNNNNNNNKNNEDEINNEILRIHAEENQNIKLQNLTNSEVEDINNKLHFVN